MFRSLTAIAIMFGVSSASACLQAKPNYTYKLGGDIQLQENGQAYTACAVTGGYLTLKNNEIFRIQGLVIECNERMLGHNSYFFELKNGQVNPTQSGFSGSYDKYNLSVTYSVSDVDGTYDETNVLEFTKKCDAVSIDIDIKKSGKENYSAKISGLLTSKINRSKKQRL